jgi:nicotinate-nucleotide--dimethylbenzimidazole phosphoribosyltransferase
MSIPNEQPLNTPNASTLDAATLDATTLDATTLDATTLDATLRRIKPTSAEARSDALTYHDRLTKPRGALGLLEALGAQLCAISGEVPPPIPTPAAVAIFAADHGVLAEGVSPWPKEVTGQMVHNFASGGAAINVLARQMNATVTVVNVGVDCDPADWVIATNVLNRSVARGTRNLAIEPAMSLQDALRALIIGIEVANALVHNGAQCLVTGDMGIGNTTSSAALIASFAHRSASDTTGRGTGIDDAMLTQKVLVIERALQRISDDATPLETLAEIGGLEIAALCGFILGGAANRVPVIIDGVIALAAACVAHALSPVSIEYAIAGHRSTEPGATIALQHLQLTPLIDLQLRLGEGSGACLALPHVEAAARILREMATFDGAGVTEKP